MPRPSTDSLAPLLFRRALHGLDEVGWVTDLPVDRGFHDLLPAADGGRAEEAVEGELGRWRGVPGADLRGEPGDGCGVFDDLEMHVVLAAAVVAAPADDAVAEVEDSADRGALAGAELCSGGPSGGSGC
jgi:hypothetical protein